MTTKDDVVRVYSEHPEWTARQIADHLNIKRYHVYNIARTARLILASAPMPDGATGNLPALLAPEQEDVVTPAADFIVYANNPADMMRAQQSMIAWCDDKITVEAQEQQQAQHNLDAAITANFSADGWKRQVKLLGEKIDFYEKTKAALLAGYYIVPPFPIDMFAIRTKASWPKGNWTTRNWRTAHEQKEQLLPAGEGDYVSPDPKLGTTYLEHDDGKGGTKNVQHWRSEEWKSVEFPFALAKAEILSATRAAMALKVFDRIGVLPTQRAPDPIVCGQILMPHRHRAPLTFFISWWLDTRTL